MGALASVDLDKRDVIVSRNPATGEVLGEVPESTTAEVQRRGVASPRRAGRVGRAAGQGALRARGALPRSGGARAPRSCAS